MLTKDNKERIDTWIYDNDQRKALHLTCEEALLLCIIQQTQCRRKGCCPLSNKFLIDKTGIKEKYISKILKKLSEIGVVWIGYRIRSNKMPSGYERHIVVPESLSRYRRFLVRAYKNITLKKFNEEFGYDLDKRLGSRS